MLSENAVNGREHVTQPRAADSDYPQSSMRVTKRSGRHEAVDVNKIVRAVSRSCVSLRDVDPLRVATKTTSGLYDGATTRELDQLSIQTAAGLIVEEPEYAKLAARLLGTYIEKEVRTQEIHAFSQSVARGHALGLINDRLRDLRSRPATRIAKTTVDSSVAAVVCSLENPEACEACQ